MEQFNILQNEKCVSVKKEKLNDLKNRISFALKDATLQQGFEIICKRIAELEKENAEQKAQIKKMCCKNIYHVSDKNSNAVPCYTFYNCRNCTQRKKTE